LFTTFPDASVNDLAIVEVVVLYLAKKKKRCKMVFLGVAAEN